VSSTARPSSIRLAAARRRRHFSSFFQQSEEKHTLVLADDKIVLRCLSEQAVGKLHSVHRWPSGRDTILGIEQEYKVNTGMTSLADYDFQKPNTSLYTHVVGPADISMYEGYDYPGDYTTKRRRRPLMPSSAWRNAKFRSFTVRGKSNCMGFECGYKFTLSRHFRDSANQDYTLIAPPSTEGQNTSYGRATPRSVRLFQPV